jgi:hypothetical protein
MKLRNWIALGICLALVAGTAQAGTLRIGSPNVNADEVVVPIVLDNSTNDPVVSMNFRFNYDPAVLEPVSASEGAVATAADKGVHANVKTPGQYNVLLFGMNYNTLESGEVASIVMRKIAQPESGEVALSIGNTTFTDADAQQIPSEGSRGSVRLEESAQDEEADDTPAREQEVDDVVGGDGGDSQEDTPAPVAQVTSNTSMSDSAGQVGTQPVRGSGTSGALAGTVAPNTNNTTAAERQRLASAVSRVDRARSGISAPGSAGTGDGDASIAASDSDDVKSDIPGADKKGDLGEPVAEVSGDAMVLAQANQRTPDSEPTQMAAAVTAEDAAALQEEASETASAAANAKAGSRGLILIAVLAVVALGMFGLRRMLLQ